MDLKEAKYILSIYENNSISKAAKELFISQPSLSRYLQNVENRLGSPLFDRSGNQYIPTYLGQRYIRHAHNLLRIEEQWQQEYQEILTDGYGTLTIALPLMRSFCLIPDVLPKFQERYPNVQVILREESHAISDDFVLTEEIDFAIFNAQTHSSKITYEYLGEEELVLVCNKGNQLAQLTEQSSHSILPYVDLAKLQDCNFVQLSRQQHTGALSAALFEQHKLSPNVILTTRSQETALALAASGSGLCFSPMSYVNHLNQQFQVDCYSVAPIPVMIKLEAAYRKGKILPDYGKFFLSLMKNSLHQ